MKHLILGFLLFISIFSISAHAEIDPFGFHFIYESTGSRQYKLDEAKAMYRRRVMKAHPDQGGSAEEFKALTKVYHEMKAMIAALPENGMTPEQIRKQSAQSQKPRQAKPSPKTKPKPQTRFVGGKYEVNYYDVFDLNHQDNYDGFPARIESISNDPSFRAQKQLSEIELTRHKKNAIAIFSHYEEFLKYLQLQQEKGKISEFQFDLIFKALRSRINAAKRNPYQNCILNMHQVGKILDIRV